MAAGSRTAEGITTVAEGATFVYYQALGYRAGRYGATVIVFGKCRSDAIPKDEWKVSLSIVVLDKLTIAIQY